MDKAITSKDYADREFRDTRHTTRDRIKALAYKHGHKLDEAFAGVPVKARIDFGRWIAECECGGAEAVDPKDAVFFCVSCGNAKTSGKLRKVIFPDDYKAVEKEDMARPLKRKGTGDVITQQVLAKPKGEPRNWSPE